MSETGVNDVIEKNQSEYNKMVKECQQTGLDYDEELVDLVNYLYSKH